LYPLIGIGALASGYARSSYAGIDSTIAGGGGSMPAVCASGITTSSARLKSKAAPCTPAGSAEGTMKPGKSASCGRFSTTSVMAESMSAPGGRLAVRVFGSCASRNVPVRPAWRAARPYANGNCTACAAFASCARAMRTRSAERPASHATRQNVKSTVSKPANSSVSRSTAISFDGCRYERLEGTSTSGPARQLGG